MEILLSGLLLWWFLTVEPVLVPSPTICCLTLHLSIKYLIVGLGMRIHLTYVLYYCTVEDNNYGEYISIIAVLIPRPPPFKLNDLSVV